MKHTIKTIALFLIIAAGLLAQTAPTPAPQQLQDPETLNRVITVLVKQRDQATSTAQNLEAQLALLQQDLEKAKAKIAELEKKPEPKKP